MKPRVVAAAFLLTSGAAVGQERASAANPAAASPAKPTAGKLAPRVERYQLANGLKAVLAPDDRAVDVAVAVEYAAGSAHAPHAVKGLPHLVEHLAFYGTRHLKPFEATEILDELGAGYNAFVASERTVYFASLPTEALATGLWLESERMAFALDGVDAAALENETKDIANELAEREHSLAVSLSKFQRRALYGASHPCGFQPIVDT